MAQRSSVVKLYTGFVCSQNVIKVAQYHEFFVDKNSKYKVSLFAIFIYKAIR